MIFAIFLEKEEAVELSNYMYGDATDMVAGTGKYLTLEEWEDIQSDLAWLAALEQAGVDNWDGYGLAEEIFDAFNQA